jgi:hypothetical protein
MTIANRTMLTKQPLFFSICAPLLVLICPSVTPDQPF